MRGESHIRIAPVMPHHVTIDIALRSMMAAPLGQVSAAEHLCQRRRQSQIPHVWRDCVRQSPFDENSVEKAEGVKPFELRMGVASSICTI